MPRPIARCLCSLPLLLAVSSVAGCTEDGTGNTGTSEAGSTATDESASTTGAPTPDPADGTTTGGATSTDATSTAETDSEDTDTLPDVGPPDMGEPEPQVCDAVDILFVIDNSLSMSQHQMQLALGWPTLVDAMWADLPAGTNLHVGLTTTSFFDGPCSESTFSCVSQATAEEILDHYITPDLEDSGVNGAQGRLFQYDGVPFFEATVGEDSVPVEQWFSEAVVAAGETGCSFEMMSAAAGYALNPVNDATNTGFLRDEGAVLAIVVLTDEPDKSPEGASTYYDMVVDAKAGCGGDECVVITGLVDQCIEGVDDNLWQFFNQFPSFGTVGSIDQPADHEMVLGVTLADAIAQTCQQIGSAD